MTRVSESPRRAAWRPSAHRALLLAGGGAAVVAAAVAFLLLASGGGPERLSKPAYEQRVRDVYADVQRAFRATNVSTGLAARVGAAQAQLRAAADALERLHPPAAVAGQNAALVVGLRQYAVELEPARVAAARGDRQSLVAFNEGLATSETLEQIAEAAEAITFLGYDLGALSRD